MRLEEEASRSDVSRPIACSLKPGFVADKVMHRSLKPADVGSIPTDPTDKKATDLRLKAKGKFLKPLVLSLKPNPDL
jgi:hypothetical protein